MKKIFFIPVVFVIYLSGSISFWGCKDNITSSPPDTTYHFDSARYTWTSDTLVERFLSGLLVLDTNKIFLSGSDNLITYNGVEFTYHNSHSGDFTGIALSGIDEQNVFLGGAKSSIVNGNYYYQPALKKWNGSYLEMRNIPQVETISDGIISICVKSSNEIWLGSDRGKIFRYDGLSNFDFYRICDTLYHIIYLTEFQSEMCAIATKKELDTVTNIDVYHLTIFSYGNNAWRTLYDQRFPNSDSGYAIYVSDKKIYGVRDFDGIYEFNGTNFSKIFGSDYFTIINNARMTGNPANNFLIVNSHKLYHWNGIKWSLELEDNQGFPWNLTLHKDVFYCLSELHVSGSIYCLYRGKRNEFQKSINAF